jgi:release factor glutamine methyltransferase
MKLKEQQYIFHEKLDAIYGIKEVDSFFYILTEYFLNLKRIDIALNPNIDLNKNQVNLFEQALNRLLLDEPIQYIVGETEFYSLKFKVSNNTLIPRPETEELVEWIINTHKNQKEINILDIGTGSGCIAISLAKHLPLANVFALDISKDALEVAKQNAERNLVNLTFINTNILNKLLWDKQFNQTQFDVIVSNPPYVRQLEKKEMKGNVLNHEPELALFVEDNNPLQFYKAISEFSKIKLKPKGALYFEINQYLGAEMKQLLKDFSFKEIELKQDIFKNDRMIKGLNA